MIFPQWNHGGSICWAAKNRKDGKVGRMGNKGWLAAPRGRIPLGSYICRETAATADHLLQLRLLGAGHPLRACSSPHFHLSRLPTMYTRHLHTSLAKNTRMIHFSRWKASTIIQGEIVYTETRRRQTFSKLYRIY